MNINNHEIKKGRQTKLNLNVSRLSSSSMVEIPVIVSRSTKPGPNVLLMAGMHGDEICGVEILDRLMKSKRLKPLKGSIIIIPKLNQYGFENKQRYTKEGEDLNRCFPGNKNGSTAYKIADKFMKSIFPLIDFGIDFHSGSGGRTNYPQVRCKTGSELELDLAKKFNQPFIVNASLRSGSLRKISTLQKKPILLFEGGQSNVLDEFAIETAVNGTINLLESLRIIKPEKKKHTKLDMITMSSSRWTRADKSGIFKPNFEYGEYVKKGVILGILESSNGDKVKIKNDQSGYIIGLNTSPVVNYNDPLFHIGFKA